MKAFREVIDDLLSHLVEAVESEHFIVHYALRQTRSVGCRGAGGVRGTVVPLVCLESLEMVYRALTRLPWGRVPPKVGASRKTDVYLVDLFSREIEEDSPFTEADHQRVPYIVLPCRSDEPTTGGEFRRLAAAAVHEATHLFSFTERPFHKEMSDGWIWFDEGTAVFLEGEVLPGNHDHYRFLMDWIDRPEVPLDDPSATYQSGFFVRYLANEMGRELVNRVWTESERQETPLQAPVRLLPGDRPFVSADPQERDVFASGYSMDAYFLCDRDHGPVTASQ